MHHHDWLNFSLRPGTETLLQPRILEQILVSFLQRPISCMLCGLLSTSLLLEGSGVKLGSGTSRHDLL